MVCKRKTKCTKQKKAVSKPSKKTCKVTSKAKQEKVVKKDNVMFDKPVQSKQTKVNNYKAFIRFLLAGGDSGSELADAEGFE